MPVFATVVVASPANGSTVGTSVAFSASGNTSCGWGVATMGIYVDNNLEYVTQGSSLNTSLNLPVGSHKVYLQEWDFCGRSTGTNVALTVANQGGVHVSSPTNNSSVTNSVNFVATATSACSQGVASMGVYVNNALAAVSNGPNLNQTVTLAAGTQNAVVQSWDYCGGSSSQPITLNVSGGNVKTISQIQAAPNWNQWGELAPVYAICAPCSGVWWNMTQGASWTSLSGNATEFDIGGSTPYSDVLWSNKLIGQGTTQNMPDAGHQILPNVSNMIYSADVYVTNYSVTQYLEFDVNIYMNGLGLEWGTECNHLADGDWDIWDNVNATWVPTGAPCNLNNQAWNHIAIQVQRTSDNQLYYQSITVNGTTYNINKSYPPFSVPSSWYGLTVNYQMDGNYRMASNTTYLDNVNLQYW